MVANRTIVQIFLETLGELMIIYTALLLGGLTPDWFISLSWCWKGLIIFIILLIGVGLRTLSERLMEEITHGRLKDAIKLKNKW